MNGPNPEMPPANPPPAERPRFLLAWFTLALLLPPAATMLAISMGAGQPAAIIIMVSSPLAGFVCGFLVARRVARTTAGRILATLGFTVLFGALVYGLSFGGCMAVAALRGMI